MAKTVSKVPKSTPLPPKNWRPFGNLRKEVDRLFENFEGDFPWLGERKSVFDLEPFFSGEMRWPQIPPVDVVEKDKRYEITAELPGLDEKDIEVEHDNGMLTIRGEKKEESETTEDDVHVSERRYGSFRRSFRVPENVNADKIDASFKKGVLTLVLPKKPGAKGKEKKISVKAA